MSTKFTRSFPADAVTLPLTVLLQTASSWVMQGLLDALVTKGYVGLSEGHLTLLGNLDCGSTHASAVAHRMGVSRQAINRTMREMEALSYLRLDEDPIRRNQKLVVMTDLGMSLAVDARAVLAKLEQTLANRIGPEALIALRAALEQSWGRAGCAPSP